MRIQIETQGFDLTDAIRTHVLKQLHLNLANFEGHIISTEVFLSDTNGPRGGSDKRALIHVHLGAGLSVTVESTRDDLYAAVALATRHAKRAVRRTLSKHRRMERLALRQLRQYAG